MLLLGISSSISVFLWAVLTSFRHTLVQNPQNLLKAKNMDKVEKPPASQMLVLLAFSRTEVEHKKIQWLSLYYSRSQQQTDLGHLIVGFLFQMSERFSSSLWFRSQKLQAWVLSFLEDRKHCVWTEPSWVTGNCGLPYSLSGLSPSHGVKASYFCTRGYGQEVPAGSFQNSKNKTSHNI